MKTVWMKKSLLTAMTVAAAVNGLDTATQWSYGYTHSTQRYEVETAGLYQIELYGAQGGSSAAYAGGKGGMVSVQVSLDKTDEVELLLGGSDGYQGGGSGTLTHGGGAAILTINGKVAAVAGGGGGATDTLEGDNGGDIKRSDVPWQGESSTEPYSAGGGGGYLGGTAGVTVYHVHSGSAETGGGCYTIPVRHAHNADCYQQCGVYTDFHESSTQAGYMEAVCTGCGETAAQPGDWDSAFVYDDSWVHMLRICGQEAQETAYYQLGCGTTEHSIERNTQARGGSSYYDTELCSSVVMAAGQNEGDAKAIIRRLYTAQATVCFYNADKSLLGSITVPQGEAPAYPLDSEPAQAQTAKFAYAFQGWDDMDTPKREIWTTAELQETPTTTDKNYIAVYRVLPQEYTLTLDYAQGQQTITAAYSMPLAEVTAPVRRAKDALFAGYYTKRDGKGDAYYLPSGKALRRSDFTADATLYAYWERPLTITRQPQPLEVSEDYTDAAMEVGYSLTPGEGYQVSFQWYEEDDSGARALTAQRQPQLALAHGLPVGEHSYFCELTVTSDANGQQMCLLTDKATLSVTATPPAPDEETPDEKPSGEETPDEKPSDEETPAEKPSDEEKPAEKPSHEESPSEKPSSEEKPDEKPSHEDKPDEKPSSEEKPSENPSNDGNSSSEEKPSEKPSDEETPAEKPSNDGNSSSEEKPAEKPSHEETQSGKPSNEGKPSENPSNDRNSSYEESPSDKPLHEESSGKNPIAEAISTEKISAEEPWNDTPFSDKEAASTDQTLTVQPSPEEPTTAETLGEQAPTNSPAPFIILCISIAGFIGILFLAFYLSSNHEGHRAEE